MYDTKDLELYIAGKGINDLQDYEYGETYPDAISALLRDMALRSGSPLVEVRRQFGQIVAEGLKQTDGPEKPVNYRLCAKCTKRRSVIASYCQHCGDR